MVWSDIAACLIAALTVMVIYQIGRAFAAWMVGLPVVVISLAGPFPRYRRTFGATLVTVKPFPLPHFAIYTALGVKGGGVKELHPMPQEFERDDFADHLREVGRNLPAGHPSVLQELVLYLSGLTTCLIAVFAFLFVGQLALIPHAGYSGKPVVGSLAAHAFERNEGISEGDTILSVDGTPVTSMEGVIELMILKPQTDRLVEIRSPDGIESTYRFRPLALPVPRTVSGGSTVYTYVGFRPRLERRYLTPGEAFVRASVLLTTALQNLTS